MNIFIMQKIYRSKCLVVINGDDVNVHKYEKYKFDQPIISFQPEHSFIGKSKICEMT